MNKFYTQLHTPNTFYKKQFLKASLFLLLIVTTAKNVNAQCEANPIASQTVCNNAATAAINFTGTATTFSWTNNSPSIGLAASGTGNIGSFTALNITATAVTATITVTPSNGACTGTPISFTITVNPSPIVNVTPIVSCGGVPNGSSPCNPLTASGNASTYTWSPISGLYLDCAATIPYIAGTSIPTVYASPTSNTLYTVTGTNTTTGCIKTATAQVNYTPLAPIIVPNPVNMCVGDNAIKLSVARGTGSAQFCSGTVNIPVPDNNQTGATSSINVAGIPCNITGLKVIINMPHTRIGDMVFVLKAPNGQVINLDYFLSATGGSGATSGFVNTVISSSGTVYLSSGTNPYSSTFKADALLVGIPPFGLPTGPNGMLPTVTNWVAFLSSSTINGTWTLGFYDGATGETGTLSSWCLDISYTCPTGIPSTPAVWSPATHLYLNAANTVPYVAGTSVDSVWVRPVPAGVYTYQVTTQGIPPSLCTPSTNFTSTNGDALVTFNIRNNNPFAIRLSQIDSKTLTSGPTFVSAYHKPAFIAGNPGAISPANGWSLIGTSFITGTGTSVQPFISNIQTIVIPAGMTVGICLQALTSTNTPNLSYSALSPGTYTFADGGCEIVTGTNIGYSGANAPAAPTTTPSGFIGAVHFSQATTACTSPPTTVVVTVSNPMTVTQQPVNQTICIGISASFNVVASGAGPFSYQWQVSFNGGATYTNLTNTAPFTGVTTNSLLINTPPIAMSGYLFRVIVNGGAGNGCSGGTSTAALLTVNPLPTVTITANPLIIGPTQTTTIRSTVTPNAAATYIWYRNGVIVPGAAADTILVDVNNLGDYQLRVIDVNGCTNLSNIVTIAHSFSANLFTYPNPSGGLFQVRYYSEANSSLQRSVTVYNNQGVRILSKAFTQSIPYQKIDIDVRTHGKGVYWIELRDTNGKRVAINRAVVL